MALRKDLPHIPSSLLHASMPKGVMAASERGSPQAAIEAMETVGAQVREHRQAIDAKLGEIQANLQGTQQTLAKLETQGFSGGGGAGNFSKSVSAQVLEGSENALEDMRTGVSKKMRMSVASLHTAPSAATITSPGVPTVRERDSEVYGPLRRMFSVRDLLVTRNTTASAIEYLRGTRTGAAAIQAAEGDLKAELAMTFSLQTSPVRTIACWVPASRQVLDDSSMLADYIDGNLRDALRLTEDAQLLKGDGQGSNLLGLMNLASAYNRGKAGDSLIDTLRRAITQVQLARGEVSGIVINPALLEVLELQKDSQGRYVLNFEVTDSNGRTVIWRVPVVITDAVGEFEFLVGDFVRAARLYDRRQATVEVATEHADFFTRNLVAILCEERVALTIPRPDLLVIGNFGTTT